MRTAPRPHALRYLAIAALLAGAAAFNGCGPREEARNAADKKQTVPIPEGEVARAALEERDGLWHQPGSDQPFTGTAVARFGSGEIAAKEPFVEGKLDGVGEEWLKDGTKKRETHYRDGQAFFQRVWRADGSKKIEAELKDGKLHGTHKRWHANGKLGFDGNYSEGRFHGLQIDRDENGVLLMKARFENGTKVEDLMPPQE